MEMLCVADIHGDREAVRRLKRYAAEKGFKHILILGDFPGHGFFRDTKKALDEVRFTLDTLSGVEIYAIPGNCDPPEILDVLDEYSVNLHEKVVSFEGTSILGLGGSAPTPFNTPFEMGEDVIFEKLERLISGVTAEKVVVAVHSPPLNTKCDMRANGDHVGSSAIREFIDRFQPEALLCSHIHESGGSSDVLGSTRVANIGPLSQGRAAILGLGKSISLKLGVFR